MKLAILLTSDFLNRKKQTGSDSKSIKVEVDAECIYTIRALTVLSVFIALGK